jgi:hypothetical protein
LIASSDIRFIADENIAADTIAALLAVGDAPGTADVHSVRWNPDPPCQASLHGREDGNATVTPASERKRTPTDSLHLANPS